MQVVQAAAAYVSSGMLSLFFVYIREAHPEDGWSIPAGNGRCYKQTHTLQARLQVAQDFLEGCPAVGDVAILVDDPATNAVDRLYEAAPERLVLLDHDLRVVFASGQGPFQYHVEALVKFTGSRNGDISSPLGGC